MRKTSDKKKNTPSSMVRSVFCVAGEMISGKGEDSYLYAVNGESALIAAFDGCGGIGSKRYLHYSEKTGAYIASRAVCGGVKNWFDNEPHNDNALPGYIQRALKVCEYYADAESGLRGSLRKSFPTTAAMIRVDNGSATCFWAGDSRCYLLDAGGLHQLSNDDIDGEDAFSNISGDGVLTNVICSSVPYDIHAKHIPLQTPCVLLTASDGCFGYLNTPMDFEYLLTSTLMMSNSISEWEYNLDKRIKEFTGDDYTMCVAVYGYEDFQHLRNSYAARASYVYTQYINSAADDESKWNAYKDGYSIYLESNN